MATLCMTHLRKPGTETAVALSPCGD